MSTLKLIKLLSNEIHQATSFNNKHKTKLKPKSSLKAHPHFFPNKTTSSLTHRPISTDNNEPRSHSKLKSSKNTTYPTQHTTPFTLHKKSRNTNDPNFTFKSRNNPSSSVDKNGMSFIFEHFTIKHGNSSLIHNDSYNSMNSTNKDTFTFTPIQRKDTQVLDKHDSILVKKNHKPKASSSSLSPFMISKKYSYDSSSNEHSPIIPRRCNSIDRLYNETLSKNFNWALSKDKADILNTSTVTNKTTKPFSLNLSSKQLSLKQILNLHENDLKIASTAHRSVNPNILKPQPKKIYSIQGRTFAGVKPNGVLKSNQDSFFIEKNFLSLSNQYYIGVCDGHGELGHFASNFISKNLHHFVSTNLISNAITYIAPSPSEQCLNTLITSFQEANMKLTSHQLFDVSLSGTTCSSVIISSKCVYCLNVGDSRTVLGKCSAITNQYYVEELSEDHKPENENEKRRIIDNGGRVDTLKSCDGKSVGPYRLWLKDYNTPGLAMSRSFGDTIAASVGLIAVPQIKIHTFTKEDKFIICGSDGLWEFVSSKECVKIVSEYYIKRNINGAITKLYDVAKARWLKNEESSDDITIVIVFLDEL